VGAAALRNVSFGEILVGILVMAGLSMFVYWHASKHGSRHATAWGIAGFFWPGFLFYFLRYFLTRRRF
jgi:hypothetical protein